MSAPEERLFGGLSHARECCYCGHEDHRMRCLEPISKDVPVPCPCRGGPAPGIYPPGG